MNLPRLLYFTGLIFLIALHAVDAHSATDEDILNLPIESLMNLKVTSVSKKPQQLTNAAAAVFVISEDDIKRSGVTNIADALRMVPGVQVARVDSSKWAVTARGLNSRFANKLLVLQDGRSLYTPLFSGVYWEVQDTPLEDIDRIEVIRGPGAALWGANAVNGVINIITKSAEDTKGGLVSTGGGSSEKGFATIRYGTSIGDSSFLRLYGKHNEHGAGVDSAGNSANDSWNMTRTGFRLDSTISNRDTVTVQGDYYSGAFNETYKLYAKLYPNYPDTTPGDPYEIKTNSNASGANILTRWQHTPASGGNMTLQLYYDHNERDMLVLPQKFDTVDVDFQHSFSLFDNQEFVWGLGYRFNRDQVSNTNIINFNNQQDDHYLFSTFFHDEIVLVPKKLSLVLGSRFENNDYSGFEIQPNVRILWTPTAQQSLWGAVSRSVRTPSRGEQDLRYQFLTQMGTGIPLLPASYRFDYIGNPNFKSEEMVSYEIGYRIEPLPRLSFDVAAYRNVYDNLRVASGQINPAVPVTSLVVSNDMHGNSYGAEVSAEWTPVPWWRVQTAYSYQKLKMFLDNGSSDTVNKGNAESSTPHQQISLRSGFDLSSQVTLDLWLRGTSRIEQINELSETISVPGYMTMDVRVAWKLSRQLELSLVGQNLLSTHHPEFNSDVVNTINSEVPRSVYGKVTWKF